MTASTREPVVDSRMSAISRGQLFIFLRIYGFENRIEFLNSIAWQLWNPPTEARGCAFTQPVQNHFFARRRLPSAWIRLCGPPLAAAGKIGRSRPSSHLEGMRKTMAPAKGLPQHCDVVAARGTRSIPPRQLVASCLRHLSVPQPSGVARRRHLFGVDVHIDIFTCAVPSWGSPGVARAGALRYRQVQVKKDLMLLPKLS